MDNQNEDKCSHNGQGGESKRKGFYDDSKRKMGSKVSRIPTSKMADNTAQFKKETELKSLILVWQRDQPQDQEQHKRKKNGRQTSKESL